MARPRRDSQFHRLDRPVDRTGDGQPSPETLRFLAEYRAAYRALKQSNPTAAAAYPDPDAPPRGFDPGEALASIRRLAGGLEAVPPGDVRS